MDWTYSVSDAVAMPQNTNQIHVVIDETMSINLSRRKVWPGLRPTFTTTDDHGRRKKPQRLINSFARFEMKLK